jgi:hypothetical protein
LDCGWNGKAESLDVARGRLKGRRARFSDYERLFETEHLFKFSGAEVGFMAISPESEQCKTCIHWFINQVSGWTPCEIMSLGKHHPVPAAGICRFWNQDGKHYPLLDSL